jgi:hypothetical protein
MPWTAIASCVVWVVAGLGGASIIRRLGYHPRTWSAVGAAAGPLVLVVWGIRRARGHRGPEVIDAGWPPRRHVGLVVLPLRGPTPELVRAVSELRGAGRATVARVVAFDAPRREVARCRRQLTADRDALGLPTAELVLLFGSASRAVEEYGRAADVGLVLVDANASDLVARIESVRVVTPADVLPAARRPSVRVLGLSRPVAPVVPLLQAPSQRVSPRARPGPVGRAEV